ncbi:MAG: tetratricopeptide repeat protein, partial [candidate division Zixibacteria bacterium]|nr:tetratricopeptide repeat protein [candidate division Zixibacteria bacterium]
VDCQSVFDESIAALIESYDSEKLKYDDLILFAHALDIDRYANHLHIDSLLTRPDRTESYLKYYLKKYEGPDDFSEKMKLLSGGDSEIADGYIKYLIESDYFRFSERGWQAAGDFDDTKLPPAIVKGFARKESRLDENLRRLLRWLAVLDCETDLRTLAGLTGQKPNELEQALKILKTTAWLQERDGRYCFLGRAKAMAIYENILLDAKLSLHRQAADFFETNEPAAIELMARHNFAAKNYPSALKYNYQAALNWYDKFDFKKAWEFIEVAEKSTANLDQNSQYVQLLIDTYILAGDIAKALADNKPAEQKYLKAIDLAQEHGCKKSVAIANKNLGDLCRLQQKSNESITYSTVALKLYSSTEDLPNQAACLNNLGLAHWTSGNYDKALDYFEKALKLNEEMGNLQEQSKINNNIGIIYDITGKTGEVFKRFQNALECAVEVGNPELEAKILGNLGFFSLNSGKPHKALDYLIKGYEIARKIGNDNEQLNIISNIALAYHKTGDFIKSAEANQNTLEIATSLNHEMFQAQSSHLLAKDCVAMGNFKLASEMLTRAGRICSKLDNPELMVDIIQTKIELELKLGDIETCYQQLDLLTRQKSFTHKQKLKTALLELKLAFMQNDRTALAKTERLLTLCEETDFIEITGQVELELAKSALDLDQTEQVAYIIQRYQSLDIKNTIINFDYQLISARFHQHKQDFNEALDLVKRIQREANNSGCVPTLFEAAVLEAGIFDRCRKEQQAFKAVKQANNIMKVLIGAFPEGKDENLINSLPSIKKLRELSDIYSRNSKIKR